MPEKTSQEKHTPQNSQISKMLSYLSDEKVQEVKQKLGCEVNEARKVQYAIYHSKKLSEQYENFGPSFDLSKISEVINEFRFSINEAISILNSFQIFYNLKLPIDYSMIRGSMDKLGCDVLDGLEACIALNDTKMSISQYPIIKSVMKKIGCNAKEAILTIDRRKLLPLDLQYEINYDKIKQARDAIGCSPVEALVALQQIPFHNYPEDFDKIKKIRKALGHGSRMVDTFRVLVALKRYKEEHDLEPTFSIEVIPSVMKEIDGNADDAISVLCNLQLKQWPKDIEFSFSEIKTMKEIVGDKPKFLGEKTKLTLATALAITKQMDQIGFKPQKKWNNLLKELSNVLKHSQITELMRMSWKDKMTVAQKVNSKTTTTTRNISPNRANNKTQSSKKPLAKRK